MFTPYSHEDENIILNEILQIGPEVIQLDFERISQDFQYEAQIITGPNKNKR